MILAKKGPPNHFSFRRVYVEDATETGVWCGAGWCGVVWGVFLGHFSAHSSLSLPIFTTSSLHLFLLTVGTKYLPRSVETVAGKLVVVVTDTG